MYCSDLVNLNWKDSPTSVLDIYRGLIDSGLRIWIFRYSSIFNTIFQKPVCCWRLLAIERQSLKAP